MAINSRLSIYKVVRSKYNLFRVRPIGEILIFDVYSSKIDDLKKFSKCARKRYKNDVEISEIISKCFKCLFTVKIDWGISF